MQPNSDYARIITAAHRGNPLAQQALGVIEDVQQTLAKSCDENYIIRPRMWSHTQIAEAVAAGLIAAGLGLKA